MTNPLLTHLAEVELVRTESISGIALKPGPVMSMEMSLSADWVFDGSRADFRFTIGVVLFDRAIEELDPPEVRGDESKAASISVVLIVSYSFPDGDPGELTATDCAEFVQERGMGDVTPYVREAVSATAGRLGYPSVVIGSMPDIPDPANTRHGRSPAGDS